MSGDTSQSLNSKAKAQSLVDCPPMIILYTQSHFLFEGSLCSTPEDAQYRA